MDHQQQNRRRVMDAGAGQNHPPPQPCPRCNSNNTKFCYYNNYSLSQPRFFCKGCRRYWTQGGTLRNVPVGGGCRKSKRPKITPPAAATTVSPLPLLQPLPSQQLVMNAHDHRFMVHATTTATAIGGANESTDGTNTSTGRLMMGHNLGVFGSVAGGSSSSSGFMSPLNFGTNMGLLHQQRQQLFQHLQQQQNQDPQLALQGLYTTREAGSSSSAVTAHDWGLQTLPIPPASVTNNTHNNNDDDNNNNNRNQGHEWPDFMGTGGLDDE